MDKDIIKKLMKLSLLSRYGSPFGDPTYHNHHLVSKMTDKFDSLTKNNKDDKESIHRIRKATQC